MQATTRCEMAASFAFGAERVQFAKNFLGDELERAPDRLVLAQMMRELREMTFQARQFFGNVGAIGEERDLFYESLVVGLQWQSRLVEPLDERGAIFFHHVGMQARGFPSGFFASP